MINAKRELLDAFQEYIPHKTNILRCALIKHMNPDTEETKTIALPVNYTLDELFDFFKKLDFNYDDGYGRQELYGTVWLKDNTWFSRYEYDGSEWWIYNEVPPIPKECC